jgi:hypothetical protein
MYLDMKDSPNSPFYTIQTDFTVRVSSSSHMILDIMGVHLFQFLIMSMLNAPKADQESQYTRPDRYHVCTSVANQAFITLPFSTWEDLAMRIIHDSIEEVEDVARHNGCERHAPPILTKTVDSKSFGDKGGENAEQKTISKTCQSRYKLEIVRVFDANCAELCSREDQGCNNQAPRATGM